MVEALPDSVRYVKNGAGGQWWEAAKDNGQIHAGWRNIPDALLRTADMGQIERLIRAAFGNKRRYAGLQGIADSPGGT